MEYATAKKQWEDAVANLENFNDAARQEYMNDEEALASCAIYSTLQGRMSLGNGPNCYSSVEEAMAANWENAKAQAIRKVKIALIRMQAKDTKKTD